MRGEVQLRGAHKGGARHAPPPPGAGRALPPACRTPRASGGRRRTMRRRVKSPSLPPPARQRRLPRCGRQASRGRRRWREPGALGAQSPRSPHKECCMQASSGTATCDEGCRLTGAEVGPSPRTPGPSPWGRGPAKSRTASAEGRGRWQAQCPALPHSTTRSLLSQQPTTQLTTAHHLCAHPDNTFLSAHTETP